MTPCASHRLTAVLLALSLLAGLRLPARARSPRLIVALVDGCDWAQLAPCMAQGRCPHFRALVDHAAATAIRSVPGEFSSPVIWTTIATGKTQGQHGVPALEFVPSRTLRRVKALWNIFGEAGWRVGVFGYRVTSPTEAVNGVMLSDQDEVFPPGAVDLAQARAGVSPVHDAASLGRLFWDDAGAQKRTAAEERLEGMLLRFYSHDEVVVRSAEQILRRQDLDLLVVGLLGVDGVSHQFQRFATPEWEETPPAEAARYSSIIARYYERVDAWLGRILEYAGPETGVLVLADHGMARSGPEESHAPGGMHESNGVFIISSRDIARGADYPPMLTVDVLPTLLYLNQTPVGQDMDGRVFQSIIRPETLTARPISYVATYETPPTVAPPAQHSRQMSPALSEALKAAGYIR